MKLSPVDEKLKCKIYCTGGRFKCKFFFEVKNINHQNSKQFLRKKRTHSMCVKNFTRNGTLLSVFEANRF